MYSYWNKISLTGGFNAEIHGYYFETSLGGCFCKVFVVISLNHSPSKFAHFGGFHILDPRFQSKQLTSRDDFFFINSNLFELPYFKFYLDLSSMFYKLHDYQHFSMLLCISFIFMKWCHVSFSFFEIQLTLCLQTKYRATLFAEHFHVSLYSFKSESEITLFVNKCRVQCAHISYQIVFISSQLAERPT